MNKLIVFGIIALIQGIVAVPRAKQSQAVVEKSQLEELAMTAQQLVNNVTASFGFKDLDSKKVVEVLNTNAQTLATHVNEAVEKFKTEMKAHQPEFENVLKSVEKQLTETATTLQNVAGPEAAAKAKEIKTNLDQGLKTTVTQIEKLIKAVEPDATKARNDIQNVAKTLLDQIVEISNNIQTQVKHSLAEHEKTHKH